MVPGVVRGVVSGVVFAACLPEPCRLFAGFCRILPDFAGVCFGLLAFACFCLLLLRSACRLLLRCLPSACNAEEQASRNAGRDFPEPARPDGPGAFSSQQRPALRPWGSLARRAERQGREFRRLFAFVRVCSVLLAVCWPEPDGPSVKAGSLQERREGFPGAIGGGFDPGALRPCGSLLIIIIIRVAGALHRFPGQWFGGVFILLFLFFFPLDSPHSWPFNRDSLFLQAAG